MSDPQSPENIKARASQEDPIVMYLIVRESLNMSAGKIAAQCAHASQMLQLKYGELHLEIESVEDLTETFGGLPLSDPISWLKVYPKYYSYYEWLMTSFRKVVLKADEKEWLKIKEQVSEDYRILVVDAGLTELDPNTETVIGLWPMRKSARSNLLKRLRVLK